QGAGGEPKNLGFGDIGDKDLRDRLDGKFFPLDPYGRFPSTKDAPQPDKKMLKDPKDFKLDPKKLGAGDGAFEVNRLIRFVDVDLKPGYTYAYSVQAYLANPFYGRKDADNPAWSKQALLRPSPRAIIFTPPVTPPGEFFYYAVEQHPRVADIKRGNDTG